MRACSLLIGLGAVTIATACGSNAPVDRDAADVTVASFNFPESRTLAEIYAQALERDGYTIERALDLASREVVEPALEQGAVDLAPEYMGTALAFIDPLTSVNRVDQAEAYELLQRSMGARGIQVLAAAPAQNQNGLAVAPAVAARFGLTKISDLAPVADELVLGGPPECPERPYCLPGFRTTYGLRFKEFRALDAGGPRTIGALESADIDVGVVFTTDPTLGGADPKLVMLADDLALQPPENVVPFARRAVVRRHGPKFVSRLDAVSRLLTTPDLIALNRRVTIDGVAPANAAAAWLDAHGF
jgi:osmoprotectant transport system substrate-binding protein